MPEVRIDNRAMIRLSGPEAEHFLHNLITADIEGLPANEWRTSALLTAQGKVQFAFLVARDHNGFVIDCDGTDAADLFKRLKFYRLRAKVEIDEPEFMGATVVLDQPVPSSAPRDSRFTAITVTRFPGLTRDAVPMPDEWNALRIRFGIAEPHTDYAYGDVFPHDINLDQIGGVSFKKGCYVGQEVVSRMQHRGTARWRVMVAVSESELVAGSQVTAGGKPAGQVGTVASKQALALVRLDRIQTALDSGAPVMAGDAAISLKFPENVTFSWPESVMET